MGFNRVRRETLEAASNALVAGKTDGCRSWALRALHRAREQNDGAGKADAYLLLSRAEFIDSRASSSHGLSELALRCAEALHDPSRAAESLELQSCTASLLGWTELAASSAKESIRLRGQYPDFLALANSYNYLAVATAWKGDFANADVLFSKSAVVASESSSPDQRFQPLVNQCFAQLLNIHEHLRAQPCADHREVDIDLLNSRFEDCRQMLMAGQIGVLNQGMQEVVGLLLVTLGCQVSLLTGDLEAADSYLQAGRSRANRLPRTHWARALHWWADVEHARTSRDHRRERLSRNAMQESARTGQHRPLLVLSRAGG